MWLQKLFFVTVLLFFISTFAFGEHVSLVWDPSITPTVTGYKVYIGNASRTYKAPIVIGNQISYTVLNMPVGLTYFAVTAFDADGNESDFSNEVSTEINETLSLPITLYVQLTPILSTEPKITWHAVTALGMVGATIAWQTNELCSATLWYGTSTSALQSKVGNNQGTTDHLVNLTSLISKTAYVYQLESVCSGTVIKSPVYSFNTKVQ
jgi:fibronectin type 3 domain-containing protein